MIMRSPVAAMLWENWQLTRVEAGQRLALGLLLGAGALMMPNAGPVPAFWILALLHGMFVWLSILKLNGGRFMDGYKPGFPFYLLYSRPIPTTTLVGVAMLYDALTCLALYLVSAALLGYAFGQPLPMFSMTLWILAFHLAYMFIQWSTPSRVVQWVGSFALHLPLFFVLKNSVTPTLQVEFSLIANTFMFLICVVSVVLTIAGVARQRRGDALMSQPATAGSGGYPTWLINFFRFSCPTTSATKAQVWFELKSSGLPVLAIGLGVAMLIFLLFVIGISAAPVRFAAIAVAFLCIPIVLFHLGGNAFGIRRKQGRMYASAFEVTQPYGTWQLAALKVLVRSACVLTALSAIGLSVWASSSLLGQWGVFQADGNKDALPGLLQLRSKIGAVIGALPGYAYAALAVVVSVAIAGLVAGQAAREALKARYPRTLLVVNWLPVVWGLVIMLVALAGHKGIVSREVVVPVVLAMIWLAAALIALATIYFLWTGLAGRSLTIRYACGAIGIWVVFTAAWVTALEAVGVQVGQMPVSKALALVWPVLLPLMGSILAPWALNRVRHV